MDPVAALNILKRLCPTHAVQVKIDVKAINQIIFLYKMAATNVCSVIGIANCFTFIHCFDSGSCKFSSSRDTSLTWHRSYAHCRDVLGKGMVRFLVSARLDTDTLASVCCQSNLGLGMEQNTQICPLSLGC